MTFKIKEFVGYDMETPFLFTENKNDIKNSKKKLKAAAKFLRELKLPKKAKFDINTFGTHDGDHEPTEKNYCGTSACALGWMAIKKKFGLTPIWKYEGTKLDVVHSETQAFDFFAGAKAFGITVECSGWLFDPIHYFNGTVKKEDVAERIEWVAENEVYFKYNS